MIPFVSVLDDLAFDNLVEMARGRLPALAPQWTDYNIHDPGIMLVELLAWVADSQIYSLARDRKDERLAMAALLGVAPRGAVPARGILYPDSVPQAPVRIPAGTRILPAGARAPRVESAAAVDLLPLTIERLTLHEGGAIRDVTQLNGRARASFRPFGTRAAPGAELRIRLTPVVGAPPLAGPCLLSLGVQTEINGEVVPGLGAIEAVVVGVGELVRAFDSSRELQRSGAMIFAVEDAARLAGGEIVLRPRQPAAVVPRVMQIDLNAVPVRQRARFAGIPFSGNGRPGQTITIDPNGLFGSDEMDPAGDTASPPVWRLNDAAPRELEVRTAGGESWGPGRLEESGPADRCFEQRERADGSGIAVRFGNGINGRKPAQGEALEISLGLSCGARGNVASSLQWLVDAVRIGLRNREPLVGGEDAESIEDALARVRRKLGEERLLATSSQLRETVRALPASLGVGRVEVEEGWERGRRSPASAATRSLIAARAETGSETAAWLRAIDRAVRPRIALGERLLVSAPVYVRFRVRLAIEHEPRAMPEDVFEAVDRALRARFDPNGPDAEAWPMGRDVDRTAVAGWVRSTPGVAAIRALALIGEDGARRERLHIGRGELPLLLAVEREETAR